MSLLATMDQAAAAEKVLSRKDMEVQHVLQQYEELRDYVVEEIGTITSESDAPNKAVPDLRGYSNKVERQNRAKEMTTKFDNLWKVFEDVANENAELRKKFDVQGSSQRNQDQRWHTSMQQLADEVDAWKKKANELEMQHNIVSADKHELEKENRSLKRDKENLQVEVERLKNRSCFRVIWESLPCCRR